MILCRLNTLTLNDRISQNSDSTIENNVNKAIPFKMPRDPPHVYSCFVVNCTAQPIECNLRYDGRPNDDRFDEVVNVTIPGFAKHYFARQFFQPDLSESYCKWVKIVTHIRVKKANGQILEVDYPFDHVPFPIRNWEFHVKDEGEILSKPPTRVVNVLKYENLDQYKC
jgi:hypothetical protein